MISIDSSSEEEDSRSSSWRDWRSAKSDTVGSSRMSSIVERESPLREGRLSEDSSRFVPLGESCWSTIGFSWMGQSSSGLHPHVRLPSPSSGDDSLGGVFSRRTSKGFFDSKVNRKSRGFSLPSKATVDAGMEDVGSSKVDPSAVPASAP